ncbi:MAG: DNA mismatch repair endonuclease MutL [Ruminococcaceae bacterium]|nr:DNA mismatch repair endonuclease MutL [Oscillospiraceae bacterium]
MPRINVLPKNIADLIAAGEVVERPSSVIKEFLENSIDAGAKNVTVEIKNGGKTYIRVTDNGCGIDKEDVRKAFLSHATSKISSADDLDNIGTLGFRGEALASVAAVSKIELLTRTENEEVGTSYKIFGGEELELTEAGCPVGTTLIVRDLFYNIPARMKFLKKDVQEGNYIASILENIAVSYPGISFKFIRDGKLNFSTPGDGNLKSAIYAVFGKEYTESLLPVEYEANGISVTGFTGKPTSGRGSRSGQHFFVNGRFIKSPMCITALETAYKNSIMVGKFPPCVIFINLPFSAVDVNVHPAKTEVRFFEEKKIFDAVYQGALNALTQDTRPKASFSVAKAFMPEVVKGEQLKLNEAPEKEKQEIKIEQKSEPKQEVKFQIKKETPVETIKTSLTAPKPETVKPSEIKSTLTLKSNEEKTIDFLETEYVKPQEKKLNISIINSVASSVEKVEKLETTPVIVEDVKEKAVVVEEATIPEFRIIGEAFKTYIFVELENKMLMIDKHAAHERILFEKFKSQPTSFQQMLLVPVTVTLSPDEYNAILENKELLYKAGYDIEDFGDRCVKVNACPTELVDEDIVSITMELASYLSMNGKTVMPEKLDWIYHSMACRAAIKAGNTTTDYELRKFVAELLSRDDIRYCPHGRPVMVEVSKRDLEKQFKRIV